MRKLKKYLQQKRKKEVTAKHMQMLLEGKSWTSKDGTKTKIVEMSDGHLWNSIRYIERLPQDWRREYLPWLKAEEAYRELAQIKIPRNLERGT